MTQSDFEPVAIPDLCDLIAQLTDLKEGSEGVERILRLVYENQPISPRDVAAKTGMPVPLVSAVRREFEKVGWLVRQGGMALAPEANDQAAALWGVVKETASSDRTGGRSFSKFLDFILEHRPGAEPKWDQSHATRKTLVKRAEFFLDQGWIQGKEMLFFGDDDLTSLAALHHLREKRGAGVLDSCRITVVEIDDRLVELIRRVAEEESFPLDVVQADLREGLPEGLSGRFDSFFTDPPYTAEGVRLFLNRGIEALRPLAGMHAGLAIPLAPPDFQSASQRTILESGFVIDSLTPGFNHYLGATMQGGISALYSLTLRTPGAFDASQHAGPLYTREVR